MKNLRSEGQPEAKNGELRADLEEIFGPDQLDQQLALMISNIVVGTKTNERGTDYNPHSDPLYKSTLWSMTWKIYIKNQDHIHRDIRGRNIAQDHAMQVGTFAWCTLREA